jgi:hypothetical protein
VIPSGGCWSWLRFKNPFETASDIVSLALSKHLSKQ